MLDYSTLSSAIPSSNILQFVTTLTGSIIWSFRSQTGSVGVLGTIPLSSAADSLTAFAGGGQAFATILSNQFNRFTTVATAGDSVSLTPTWPGVSIVIVNAGANSMNVFAIGADKINALSAAAAYAVAAGKSCQFMCTAAGQWSTLLSA
jgi:hypothetical protein